MKSKLSFLLKDLEVFQSKHFDSIIIYSLLMEPRKTIRNINGVLLKDIDKAGIETESSKLLSEFYITASLRITIRLYIPGMRSLIHRMASQ